MHARTTKYSLLNSKVPLQLFMDTAPDPCIGMGLPGPTVDWYTFPDMVTLPANSTNMTAPAPRVPAFPCSCHELRTNRKCTCRLSHAGSKCGPHGEHTYRHKHAQTLWSCTRVCVTASAWGLCMRAHTCTHSLCLVLPALVAARAWSGTAYVT